MLAIIRYKIFCLPVCYPKNVKIDICRTIVLPGVLYRCETSSLTLREKCRLKVYENRVLRGIFGPKRNELTGRGENYRVRTFMICTPQPKLFG
jgi:hypothetical protein